MRKMFTLASFIIRKNELILKLKDLVNEISGKNTQKSLIPLYGKNQPLAGGQPEYGRRLENVPDKVRAKASHILQPDKKDLPATHHQRPAPLRLPEAEHGYQRYRFADELLPCAPWKTTATGSAKSWDWILPRT